MAVIHPQVRYVDRRPVYSPPAARPSPEAVEIAALADRTTNALQRAGIKTLPVHVVEDGVPQAMAWPTNIEIHTGFPDANRLAVPAFILHEHSHFLRGDNFETQLTQSARELRADWGAGYRMAQLNVPPEMRQVALETFGLQQPSATHNTGTQRQQALRAGIADYHAGADFFEGGDRYIGKAR